MFSSHATSVYLTYSLHIIYFSVMELQFIVCRSTCSLSFNSLYAGRWLRLFFDLLRRSDLHRFSDLHFNVKYIVLLPIPYDSLRHTELMEIATKCVTLAQSSWIQSTSGCSVHLVGKKMSC